MVPARELTRLAASRSDLEGLQARCQVIYREHFARRRVMDEWDRELRALLVREKATR